MDHWFMDHCLIVIRLETSTELRVDFARIKCSGMQTADNSIVIRVTVYIESVLLAFDLCLCLQLLVDA